MLPAAESNTVFGERQTAVLADHIGNTWPGIWHFQDRPLELQARPTLNLKGFGRGYINAHQRRAP